MGEGGGCSVGKIMFVLHSIQVHKLGSDISDKSLSHLI